MPVHVLGQMATAERHYEPVMLEIVRECEWKSKPCGVCGKAKTNAIHSKGHLDGHPFSRRNGCERCGRPKNDPCHLGAPESFNVFASGDWKAYQTAKQRWHRVLRPLLEASPLERGMGRISVEAECAFGDDRKRDQGNHRVVIEKALGDILVEMGYLSDDQWGAYEFGGLQRKEDGGVNRLRLMLFPSAEPLTFDVGPPTLL